MDEAAEQTRRTGILSGYFCLILAASSFRFSAQGQGMSDQDPVKHSYSDS